MKTVHRLVALAVLLGQLGSLRGEGDVANERLRPLFHFTAPRGWLNDPNGLVYYGGEWHLFYQHNPNGTNWISELSWGHAVSKDLVHWRHLPDTLPPTPIPGRKVAGSWSGSGLVDLNNTAGFQAGKEKPIVLFWTATGLGQCLAYSNDRGRTFIPYERNPVVPMDPPRTGDWDRDPKVYWHEPTRKWVMAISVSGKGVVFYSSADLKTWVKEGLVEGLWECPDYFELPLDGNDGNRKWVIWDGSGKYFIGRFDGHTFTKESGPFLLDYGHNYYAAQTWSNAPSGRRISIAWMRDGRYPGMPFNQQMGVPCELKLRTTPMGVRLTKLPVEELERLRFDTKAVKDQPLVRDTNYLAGIDSETLDIEAEIAPKDAGELVLKLHGATIQYVPGLMKCQEYAAPLNPEQGRIKLRVLLDRTSIEVFGNDGAASISATFLPAEKDKRQLELYADHGEARVLSLRVHKLRSARE